MISFPNLAPNFLSDPRQLFLSRKGFDRDTLGGIQVQCGGEIIPEFFYRPTNVAAQELLLIISHK